MDALRREARLAANHDGRSERESAFAVRADAYREAINGSAGVPAGAANVVIAGLSWWIPKSPDGDGGINRRLEGQRRLPLAEILQTRELAVGRLMIDIGANIGTTSIPRVLLGDFNYVYAAEPDPGNYACLVRNVVDNGLRGLVLPEIGRASCRERVYACV